MPDMIRSRKKRILIFIVAYNAEKTIQTVVQRIPSELAEHDLEILIIDDYSQDSTFERAYACEKRNLGPFPITVLFNPVNQGYGGNQKLGFHYAIREGFDVVALVHGDGQYAPECLPELLKPLLGDQADAVFGSRMLTRLGALRGGMPIYKYIGNKVLTAFQNRLLRASLSEFHSGYRLYSVKALSSVPFECNTNDFHFDTDIIIQFLRGGLRIVELPIPTYYGDEICHVNGIKYAMDVIKSTLVSRAQDLGILYEAKFDLNQPGRHAPRYQSKFGYESPHTLAYERVQPGDTVLDIGCASGYVAQALADKGCRVSGVDQVPPSEEATFDQFIQHDLDQPWHSSIGPFNCVLLLDVIEHLRAPERFVQSLRTSVQRAESTNVIASTGNVAFCVTRLMLLLGWFNYGTRGILDRTHTRLFTFSTFKSLFEQAGYQIVEVKGVPAPFPLAISNRKLARLLLGLNKFLIRISRSLFSYQIFMVVRPLPSLEWLLDKAVDTRRELITHEAAELSKSA